jgi:hypothetical protein
MGHTEPLVASQSSIVALKTEEGTMKVNLNKNYIS